MRIGVSCLFYATIDGTRTLWVEGDCLGGRNEGRERRVHCSTKRQCSIFVAYAVFVPKHTEIPLTKIDDCVFPCSNLSLQNH